MFTRITTLAGLSADSMILITQQVSNIINSQQQFIFLIQILGQLNISFFQFWENEKLQNQTISHAGPKDFVNCQPDLDSNLQLHYQYLYLVLDTHIKTYQINKL